MVDSEQRQAFAQLLRDMANELADDRPLESIDDKAALLRRYRQFFDRRGITRDLQALLFQEAVMPWLIGAGVTGQALVEMKREFSEAVGFQVTLPS